MSLILEPCLHPHLGPFLPELLISGGRMKVTVSYRPGLGRGPRQKLEPL